MKMYISVGCVACVAVLAGCVPMTPTKPLERMSYVAPQTCSCQEQCDAMWAEGMQQLPSLTGMRIRLATNTMAETYVATTASRVTGSMNKVPAGNGSYEIQASFTPWVSDETLNTVAYNWKMLFNSRMQSVKSSTGCKAA